MTVELSVVMASGEIPAIESAAITEGGSDVITADAFIGAFIALEITGLPIPVITDPADADNSTLYWNDTTGRLQVKSPGGIVLQFVMTLAPP